MTRLARWTLNALTVLSLVLLVAVASMWGRAQHRGDDVHCSAGGKYLHILTTPETLYVRWQDRQGFPTEWRTSSAFTSAPPGTSFFRPEHRWLPSPVFGDRNDYRWLGFYFRTRFYSPAFITKNRMVPGCWGAGMGVPYYALCLVGTAIPLIRARQKDRQRRCVGGSRCHSCSYDRTGNVGGVCPECGTAIVKGNA
jgi:hypothetical protein